MIAETARPDATECYTPLQRLNPKQRAAVAGLSVGLSDEVAAHHAGVHRVTLTRWRLYDEVFRAALADRLDEIWSDSHTRLQTMVTRALDTVHWTLECADEKTRARTALGLLRLVFSGHHRATADRIAADSNPQSAPGPARKGTSCPMPRRSTGRRSDGGPQHYLEDRACTIAGNGNDYAECS